MEVAEKKVVGIHYKLTNDDGQVLDSSEGKEPLVFIHGLGMLIPGLEKALVGKTKGDQLNVSIAPEEAYGVRDDGLIQKVPKSEFGGSEKIEIGTQFQVETEDGNIIVTVIEVSDEEVTVDGNHPLSDMTLHFDVTVDEVREATEEEIAHGHVHGQGGENH